MSYIGVYSQYQTFGQSQELENLLRNNCPTLEELLERENFLFDLKAGAMQAFTEFVCKYPENLEKMVHYIVITNEQMEDHEKSRRFPYIVSEIFALENPKFYDLLFMRHRTESQTTLSNERLTTIEDDILPEYQMHHEDQCKEDDDQAGGQISGTSSENVESIIVQCASFKSKSGMHLNENIRQQILAVLFKYLEAPHINDTSMGYYAKILKPLACKYGGEFWDHIMANTNIISDMMQHINHYQIVEIVVQLLILDYKINDNLFINYRCYSFRKQLLDEMIHQMDIVSDNITMVGDMTQIFELLLDHGINHKIYEPLKDLFDSLLKPLYFYKLAKKTNLQIVYKAFSNILVLIQVNQLQDQKTSDLVQIIQQIGSLIESNLTSENGRFGIKNLYLIQALDACDKFNNPLVFESMFQVYLYKSLKEYAVNYQWNNQLQIYISSIFKSRIQDEKYCQRLIKDSDILNTLKQYLIEQPHNQSYKQKCSYGFNCFLKSTSYVLMEKCKTNKKLNTSLQETNASLMEEISKLQKIEQSYLCDAEPKSHMQEAPPEISIDRQIEMLIDAQKEEQKQSHQEQL